MLGRSVRRSGALVMVTVLGLVVGGVGSALGQDASASPGPATADTSPLPEPKVMVIAASGLTASQAIDIALQTVPDGAVVDLGQGWERGSSYWDVVVLGPDGGAVELYLDAATGEVLEQSPVRTPLLAVDGAPATSAQQAIDTALEAVPGSSVIEADLGREEGRLVWEIVLRGEDGRTEVYVDATSGEPPGQGPSGSPFPAASGDPGISAQQAIDTALDAVPGGTLVEVDRDLEGGRPIWEILVRSERGPVEVYVDATTGDVLKVEEA